jgi:hypothetical protein
MIDLIQDFLDYCNYKSEIFFCKNPLYGKMLGINANKEFYKHLWGNYE